jgi:hypothetical protein
MKQKIIEAALWLLDIIKDAILGVACVILGIWITTFGPPESFKAFTEMGEKSLWQFIFSLFVISQIISLGIWAAKGKFDPQPKSEVSQ